MNFTTLLDNLKKENIHYSAEKEKIEELRKNVTGYQRELYGIVFPQTTKEVQKVINFARKAKIALYPISRGKNIGLGSKLPVDGKVLLVSLEKMNKIIKVNEDFGTAVIEPGVTQQQLADYLNKNKSKYFIDVTGAPAGTSIIGNIMEKGVAYNTIRFNTVISFEVVLGTGEIIKTGYAHYANTSLAEISKYAPGPSLTELFIQSNFGIITGATIKLNPRTQKHIAFTVTLKDEKHIGEIVEKVKYLRQQKVLHSIAHIGNRHRAVISLAPMIYHYMKSQGMQTSRKIAEDILQKYLSGDWSLVASISGPAKMVNAAKKIVKKEMKQYGKVSFLDEKKFQVAEILSKLTGLKKLNIYLNSISPLIGLTFGKPTDEALHSIYWPKADENINWRNPDTSNFGFMFIVPVSPLRKSEVEKTLKIIKETEEEFGYKIAVTLNPIDEFILEGVVSFDFDLTDNKDKQKAHQATRLTIKKLKEAGLIPYRVDIANYDLLVDEDDIYWKKIKDLKKIFDPDNIISPKRYNII